MVGYPRKIAIHKHTCMVLNISAVYRNVQVTNNHSHTCYKPVKLEHIMYDLCMMQTTAHSVV